MIKTKSVPNLLQLPNRKLQAGTVKLSDQSINFMGSPYFRFRQFTVFHDQCAMKVGTDGVLLGAWANVENAVDILDVGTGIGLIALMLAQRNSLSKIVAIDLDENAVNQAGENIRRSPFSDRIAVELFAFRDFVRTTSKRFDLIVSNPPYFSESLLPPDKQRANARHSISLTLDDLCCFARDCLKKEGTLSLILPYDKSEELNSLCEKYTFYLKRKTMVYPLPDVQPKRILIELGMQPCGHSEENSLIIENSRHHYTREFSDLTSGFYLR